MQHFFNRNTIKKHLGITEPSERLAMQHDLGKAEQKLKGLIHLGYYCLSTCY